MADQSGKLAEALLWTAGLFVFSLAGGLLLYWLKRRIDRANEEDRRSNAELIYRLHDEGQISDEEFQRLKRLTAGMPTESTPNAENGLRTAPPADDGNRGNADTGEETPRPDQEQE